MAEECDILLFDEPTNDLDIATLENLEESFESFPGAIVLITHDRYLLERTASTVLGLRDGKGAIYGSYAQWESAREESENDGTSKKGNTPSAETKQKQPTKLSYKDARELSTIESAISEAENKLAQIQNTIDSGDHATNAAKLSELCDAILAQQTEVERLYERWQSLESLQRSLAK